jgi:hypothetical protein
MAKLADRFLFGTDFPGVPGVRSNAEKIAALGFDDAALHRILYANARELLPFPDSV